MSVTEVNERLAALTAAGTSVWLDQIRRSMIDSGELQRMVEEDSLRGVTSNPAIFEKAILGSPDYDAELESLAREGLSAREVYRRMAVRDVQLACDVLRPVYDETRRPRRLRVARGRAAARPRHRGHARAGAPVLGPRRPAQRDDQDPRHRRGHPGDRGGALRGAQRQRHAAVRGLRLRARDGGVRARDGAPPRGGQAAGPPLGRLVLRLARGLGGRQAPRGRRALRPRRPRRARQRPRRLPRLPATCSRASASPRCARPAARSSARCGPRPASRTRSTPRRSTSTGSSAPHTVNTMPLPTLMAARQSGEVTGATAAEDPSADLDALREAGIDLDDVTAKLLRDGIEAFMVPMAKLLDGIERKREAIVTDRPAAIEADLPPELEAPLAARVKRAAEEDVARRMWQRDGTLWAPEGTPEVTDRLGWLTIADKMLEEADALDDVRRRLQGRRADRRGAARAWAARASPPRSSGSPTGSGAGGLRLHVLDSTEPLQIAAVEARDRRREDALPRLHEVRRDDRDAVAVQALPRPPGRRLALRGRHRPGLDPRRPRRRSTASATRSSTTPRSAGATRRCRTSGSCRRRWPASTCGRSSRARRSPSRRARTSSSPEDNAGLWLGLALGELARAGRDKLTFVVDDPIASFGIWAEQLVAESTGKEGRGILPIADEPLLRADAYGPDRVFLHLRNIDAPDARHDEHIAALADGRTPDDHRAGARAPTTSGACSSCRSSRPPSSAGCSRSTRSTSPTCSRPRTRPRRCSTRARPTSRTATSRALLGGLEPPGYLAVMGYLPYSEAIEAAVGRLREAVIARHHVATTYGYGPRFLHSTGQFHKGGPAGRPLPPARPRRRRRRRDPRRARSRSGR